MLGRRRVRGAAGGGQPQAQDAARRDAEPVVGRLAVDQEPGLPRRGIRGRGAVAAPFLADDEQQPDARLAGRTQPLGGGNLRDERTSARTALETWIR